MDDIENKLPLGLCKQAAMKLESFMTDVMEIKETDNLEPNDKQDFETMAELSCNMLAALVNIVNKECEEAEFLGEKIPMDEIDTYPENESDIMDEEIE